MNQDVVINLISKEFLAKDEVNITAPNSCPDLFSPCDIPQGFKPWGVNLLAFPFITVATGKKLTKTKARERLTVADGRGSLQSAHKAKTSPSIWSNSLGESNSVDTRQLAL